MSFTYKKKKSINSFQGRCGALNTVFIVFQVMISVKHLLVLQASSIDPQNFYGLFLYIIFFLKAGT